MKFSELMLISVGPEHICQQENVLNIPLIWLHFINIWNCVSIHFLCCRWQTTILCRLEFISRHHYSQFFMASSLNGTPKVNVKVNVMFSVYKDNPSSLEHDLFQTFFKVETFCISDAIFSSSLFCLYSVFLIKACIRTGCRLSQLCCLNVIFCTDVFID